MAAALTRQSSPGEVLVTGAAGFIGSHTVRAFLDAGWAVTALDVKPCADWMHEAESVTPVRGPASADSVLDDVRRGRYSVVVHQGGISSTLETSESALNEVNVRQPLALAEASFAGNSRFLYASSHSVYGTILRRIAIAEGQESDRAACSGPLNLYARSKLALDEQMSRRYGASQPWMALRYTNVFGLGEDSKGPMASIISQLLRDAAQGRQVKLFSDSLSACRDYIPVENVVSTLLDLATVDITPGVYNLGSGSPISFATLLTWCAHLLGKDALDIRLIPNPIPDRYQYWTCANQGNLERLVAGAGPIGIDEIKAAAERLFGHYRLRADDRLRVNDAGRSEAIR